MKFDIIPFKQCGPLIWTMSSTEVSGALGAPEHVSKNCAGHRVEFRFQRTASFIFDKLTGMLVEVSCSGSPSDLVLDAEDLVAGDSELIVQSLCKKDAGALQGYGSIVFPVLGIALTGYVPEDLEIRSASAFAPGRWDAMSKMMKPFRAGQHQ